MTRTPTPRRRTEPSPSTASAWARVALGSLCILQQLLTITFMRATPEPLLLSTGVALLASGALRFARVGSGE